MWVNASMCWLVVGVECSSLRLGLVGMLVTGGMAEGEQDWAVKGLAVCQPG